MKKTLIIIHFLCFLPFVGLADVPIFDIVKLRIADSIVYLKFESRGILRNGDFCYYNYQNEYQNEVKEVVYGILKDPVNYNFYKELHRINIKNIYKDAESNGIIFVFKLPIQINAIVNFDQVEILAAENGNTYGGTYTEGLVEKDNEWLTKYKFEKLLEFEADGGYCNMSLFAIEGAVNSKRRENLKKLMDQVSKDENKLKNELQKLYKQKIIMLGGCSC